MISFGPPTCAKRIRVAPTRWSRDRAAGDRDPAHRVREVTVEAREEAEAVLARQVGAPVLARAGVRDAARLAAQRVAHLVDRDLEPALGQLVGGAQARHPAAQHRHSGHGRTLLRTPCTCSAITSCAASSGSPARRRRSSRSSPTRATSRRSRPPGSASGSSRRARSTCAPGALIEYRLRLHGVPVSWLTRIEEWEPAGRFVDAQLRGPYALWHHTHEFEPDGAGGTMMRDTVRYALPLRPARRARAPAVRGARPRGDLRLPDRPRGGRAHFTVSVPSMPWEACVPTGQKNLYSPAFRSAVTDVLAPVTVSDFSSTPSPWISTACGVLPDWLSKLIVTVPASASSSVGSNFSEPSAGADERDLLTAAAARPAAGARAAPAARAGAGGLVVAAAAGEREQQDGGEGREGAGHGSPLRASLAGRRCCASARGARRGSRRTRRGGRRC